ncbi:MAG: LPS export ABC transporter permease LptG [Candidatus Binatia bacterium]|nr:MAG: LPS export ABC transporter permease LptG [Candidatus Binatia bacterium]
MRLLSRFLLRESLRFAILAQAAFLVLYVTVDVFDRLDHFLRSQAPFGTVLRHLLFRLPLVVSQTGPAAVTTGILLCLATMARRNELVALRACGLGLARFTAPVLYALPGVALAAFLWNETFVPLATAEARRVRREEMERRPRRSSAVGSETWFRGAEGFYTIDYVDPHRRTLRGVTVYRVGPDFELLAVMRIPEARWTSSGWEVRGAVRRLPGRTHERPLSEPEARRILERDSFEDFLETYREPEELGFFALRRRALSLRRKGIDTSEYFVELHLKLAVPFSVLALGCLAIPLGGRLRHRTGVATVVFAGLVSGFLYWVVLAFAVSLGRNGALPPALAAWSANALTLLAALVLWQHAE